MATANYTQLREQLTQLNKTPSNSESANARTYRRAVELVQQCSVTKDKQKTLTSAMSKESNPSGWYYQNNGIQAALSLLVEWIESEASTPAEDENQAKIAASAFTLPNLCKLVSDGKIFHVEFIKRTTGELRKMTCRIGVQKHLKGGAKAYSAKAHNLLGVYSMGDKGYRSIPVETIQRLTVGGQVFQVGVIVSAQIIYFPNAGTTFRPTKDDLPLTIKQVEQLEQEIHYVSKQADESRAQLINKNIGNKLRVTFCVQRLGDIPRQHFDEAMELIEQTRRELFGFQFYIKDLYELFAEQILRNGDPWTATIRTKWTKKLAQELPERPDWRAMSEKLEELL